MTLREMLDGAERRIIASVLLRYQGDVIAAAKELGVPKRTLYWRMKRCGLAEVNDRRQQMQRQRREWLTRLAEVASGG